MKKRPLLDSGLSIKELLVELEAREKANQRKLRKEIDPFKRRGKIKTFSAEERKTEEIRRIITGLEDSDKDFLLILLLTKVELQGEICSFLVEKGLISPYRKESLEEYSVERLKKEKFTPKEVFLLWLKDAIGYT